MSPRRRSQRGHVLVLVLVMVLLLSFAAALFAHRLRLQLEFQARELSQARARALEQAAIAFTLAKLSHDPTFVGAEDERLVDGSFSVRVERHPAQRYAVTIAQRRGGGKQRRTELVLQRLGSQARIVEWLPPAAAYD